MIVKFKSKTCSNHLEVEKESDYILVSLQDSVNVNDYMSAHLSKDDLFSLIGQLLRLQSEIKKES